MEKELKLDTLKEIANIGAGEAADILSKITGKKIKIEVPELWSIKAAEISSRAELSSFGAFISQQFQGSVNGMALLYQSAEDSRKLLRSLFDDLILEDSIDNASTASLREIGNIILSAYVSAISNMTEGKITLGIPEVVLETSEVYFKNVLKDFNDMEIVIAVKNKINIEESDASAYLLLLLSFQDFELIISQLEKKI